MSSLSAGEGGGESGKRMHEMSMSSRVGVVGGTSRPFGVAVPSGVGGGDRAPAEIAMGVAGRHGCEALCGMLAWIGEATGDTVDSEGDDHGNERIESIVRDDVALGRRMRISVGEAGCSTGSPLRNETGDPRGGSHGRRVTDPLRVPNEAEILGLSDSDGDRGRSGSDWGHILAHST